MHRKNIRAQDNSGSLPAIEPIRDDGYDPMGFDSSPWPPFDPELRRAGFFSEASTTAVPADVAAIAGMSVATGSIGFTTSGYPHPAWSQQLLPAPAAPTTQRAVVFIDSLLPDLEALLETVPATARIVLLTGDRPILQQMADALVGSANLTAIHLISHGGPGYLETAAGTIDTAALALPENAAALAAIRASLAPDGDILLYGCEVGFGQPGAIFLQALADATAADIAASTNTTGAAALGGDIILEASAGQVETAALDLSSYAGVLSSGIFYSTSGTNVNTYVGDGTTITFNAMNVNVTDAAVQLIVHAFDVDYDSTDTYAEWDGVYLRGPNGTTHKVGNLVGTNDNWTYTTFDVSTIFNEAGNGAGNYVVSIKPSEGPATNWKVTVDFVELFLGNGGYYITSLGMSGQNVTSLWNAGSNGGYEIEYLLINSGGTAVAQVNSAVTETDVSASATNTASLQPNSSAGYSSWSTIPSGTYTLQATLFDSTGFVHDIVSISVAMSNDTTPPSITGPSGGAGSSTSTVTINENTTAVYTFGASETVTWSIYGGADSAKFTVTSGGSLSFGSAPNYESPTDSGGNNSYEVIVKAVDTANNSSVQTVTVNVANILEVGSIDITPATDSGANDLLTNNAHPAIAFAGDPSLSFTVDGPNGSALAASQFTAIYASGNYTLTLTDANAGAGGTTDPFGSYLAGVSTGNGGSAIDGTYTIVASNGSATATIGSFVLDTTLPVVSAFNITTATDTGADDTITKHAHPVATFAGESGLAITVRGADGNLLQSDQYTVAYSGGTYTVTLTDARHGSGGATDPFGSYSGGTATNNPVSSADGSYAVVATDAATNAIVVDSIVVDTQVITSAFDITAATDSGANDTITNKPFPVITFVGEAGLTVLLKGATDAYLEADQYSVAYAGGTYTVTLLDAKYGTGLANDPFGTYANGVASGNTAVTADGTYTIVATDLATNTATVGTFVIDTQLIAGTHDITSATDSGANDVLTNNAHPALTFTGETGLTVTLTGPNGNALDPAQYTVTYAGGGYTVTLVDAKNGLGTATDPFGTYLSDVGTGNPGNAIDGTYTLAVTDVATNQKTIGTFTIDTTKPVTSIFDITTSTDSGANDLVTNNGLPVITFAGEPNLVVQLKGTDGLLLASSQYRATYTMNAYKVTLIDAKAGGAADPFGTYAATGLVTGNPAATGDGTYTVTATDPAMNPAVVGTFTIDTTVPGVSVSVGSIHISADTGASVTDFLTNTPAQTVTATLSRALTAGEVLWGSIDAGKTWSAVTVGSGQTAVSWATTLAGTSSIQFKVSDLAMNYGVVRAQSYQIDAAPITKTVTAIKISQDSGASTTDFVTNVVSQTITATISAALLADERLWGSVNGGASWINLTSAVNGKTVTWSGASLIDGSSTIRFYVDDMAGNSGPVGSQAYTLDRTAPTGTTVSGIAISSDTGIAGDFVTATQKQTITATLSAALPTNTMLFGSLDGGTTWTNVSGKVTGSKLEWTNASLVVGTRSIVLKLIDASGNIGSTASQSYTLDMTKPAAAVKIASISVDNGTSGTDFITSVSNQTIYGTLSSALAGDFLMGSLDGGTTWTDISSSASGTNVAWTNQSLTAGAQTVMMRTQDLAGNIASTASRVVTVQNVATLSAVDAFKPEGNSGQTAFTFKVALVSPAATALSFNWIVSGDGMSPATTADFGDGTGSTMPSGTITIAKGQTEATISVPVYADTAFAQDQGFKVTLSLPAKDGKAVIDVATAAGTIYNDDVLTGSPVMEKLVGSGSAETIFGLGGNDTLDGKLGNDTLVGGDGDDLFVFSTAPNAATNLDVISDFTHGEDRIQFSKTIFTAIGATGTLSTDAFYVGSAAHDATDRIFYDSGTGALYYDADGTGAKAAVQVALLGTSTHPTLLYSDISVIA